MMLRKKQVITLLSIAVVFFLVGITFDVATTAKDPSGNPWDQVWTAISELQTELHGLNASLVEFRSDIEKHSFIKSTDFIIENDNDTIRVFSGTTGEVKSSSSTLIVAWTWIENNGLTPGRTWKEIVSLKGNFTVTDTIKIPSYTVLDLSCAQLVADTNLNRDMIQNSDELVGNTHIDIIGGVIDMNGPNQGGDMDGIEFGKVTSGKVIGVTLRNGYKGGNDPAALSIWSSNSKCAILYCQIEDCKFGFRLENSAGCTIGSNIIYNCYRGLYVRNSKYNTVFGNIIKGCKDARPKHGLHLASTYPGGCSHNTITANAILGWNGGSSIGLLIGTNSNDNRIIANSFNDNTQHVSNSGSENKFKGNAGFITENSGTASLCNNGDFAHGLSARPTSVTLTCMNATYGGVPVMVNCDYVNTNSTHVRISLYWANETAITDDLLISYYVEYQP